MSEKLISVKAFLGKYYNDLQVSSIQPKYSNTGLDKFFDQRFYIQNNKVQMIVDTTLTGLSIVANGNEIYVSKTLFDHPNIVISNSIENSLYTPEYSRSLYNSEIFSSMAYLVCQNHAMFHIIGDIDEPIYIHHKSDYETFYNSVSVFNISPGIDVEIVEEIESLGALNFVVSYIIGNNASLNLTTFYKNKIAAVSYGYRNVLSQYDSNFTHILYGKGSSDVIDETKIYPMDNSKIELLQLVNSANKSFHTILAVEPTLADFDITVNHKQLVSSKSDVTFQAIYDEYANKKNICVDISEFNPEHVPIKKINGEIKAFIHNIVERTILARMLGVKRFYDNKTSFFKT